MFIGHSVLALILMAPFLPAGLMWSAETLEVPQSANQSSVGGVEQARKLLEGGRIDDAIALLDSILLADPDRPEPYLLLGLAHYQKGNHRLVLENLSRALPQTPPDSPQYRQAVQFLGMSHYFLGHSGEAIPYLQQVLEWAPDNVQITYVLGICHIRTQNPEGARLAFARMYGVPPDSASAHLLNAQMMIRQQVESLAEPELRKALELDARLPQVHYLLGEMAIYRAAIDTGIDLLKQEIAVNPAFAMAYYRLGEAYSRQLRWEESIAPLQKSIWLNPFFSGPLIVLGKVYLKKDDLPNAEGILRRAIEMDPNNFSAHHLLAQVLQQSNRMEEARAEFQLADRLRSQTQH